MANYEDISNHKRVKHSFFYRTCSKLCFSFEENHFFPQGKSIAFWYMLNSSQHVTTPCWYILIKDRGDAQMSKVTSLWHFLLSVQKTQQVHIGLRCRCGFKGKPSYTSHHDDPRAVDDGRGCLKGVVFFPACVLTRWGLWVWRVSPRPGWPWCCRRPGCWRPGRNPRPSSSAACPGCLSSPAGCSASLLENRKECYTQWGDGLCYFLWTVPYWREWDGVVPVKSVWLQELILSKLF